MHLIQQVDNRQLTRLLCQLSSEQRAQILRQIEYHVRAEPTETVRLSKLLTLSLAIEPAVTRPMSSKGLARWIWESPDLVRGKRILDLGTGCGVQGITCMLRGAEAVVFADVSVDATHCASTNLQASGLNGHAEVHVSHLFDKLVGYSFDVVVFAQPYFEGTPIVEYGFTRGMLRPPGLLDEFFAAARRHLSEDGRVVMMAWSLAGEASHPANVAQRHGYCIDLTTVHEDHDGVQRGRFEIVVLRCE